MSHGPTAPCRHVWITTCRTCGTDRKDWPESTDKPAAWIEHHKGGDNLTWDFPGGVATPLYAGPRVEHEPTHRCGLVYNRVTKRIDRVRIVDGLVLDSFDPPVEY